MSDPMEQTNSDNAFEKEMDKEAHPLDESLGHIHATALALAFHNQHHVAMKLAKAHETIQKYVIEMENPVVKFKPPLPYKIAALCNVCCGNSKECDHTELREFLDSLCRK